MKTTLVFILFIITSTCIAQIDENKLIGLWKYEYTTDMDAVIVESSIKEFEFNIKPNKTFIMEGEKYSISGEWRMENEKLVLNGMRSDTKESDTEKMTIYKVSESILLFIINSETDEALIVNLIKIE